MAAAAIAPDNHQLIHVNWSEIFAGLVVVDNSTTRMGEQASGIWFPGGVQARLLKHCCWCPVPPWCRYCAVGYGAFRTPHLSCLTCSERRMQHIQHSRRSGSNYMLVQWRGLRGRLMVSWHSVGRYTCCQIWRNSTLSLQQPTMLAIKGYKRHCIGWRRIFSYTSLARGGPGVCASLHGLLEEQSGTFAHRWFVTTFADSVQSLDKHLYGFRGRISQGSWQVSDFVGGWSFF